MQSVKGVIKLLLIKGIGDETKQVKEFMSAMFKRLALEDLLRRERMQ